MKKIDMYKEVPEQFHNKLCDTLEQLEEKRIVRFSVKRYAVACAAVLLVTSAISVGAVELFQWYKTASERFETNKELENKLNNQGVAIPVEDSDEDNDIKMTALQAIKKDDDFYFLAALQWPEDVEWNEDILFEDTKIISNQEFQGCAAHLAGAPDENGVVYVEIDVLGDSAQEYAGEAKIELTNLIQTSKTEYLDTLVEAKWELSFDLPTDAETRSFLAAQALPIEGHVLELDKIEVSPFSVKIYTEEETGRHATYFSDFQLTAVAYEDGSVVEEDVAVFRICAAKDEADNFYFNLPLTKAIDIDKVSGLIFKEGDVEFTLALGKDVFVDSMGATLINQAEGTSLQDLVDDVEIADFHILYVRHDNVLLTDSKNIYLWDAQCGNAKNIMKLTDYGYDTENGGDLAMMPGGTVLAIKPVTDSSKVYMLDMGTYDVQEVDAEGKWPVPRYEDYKDSFFVVSDSNDVPEGSCSMEGYEAQGRAYVLYSPDGSIENMELMDINNK